MRPGVQAMTKNEAAYLAMFMEDLSDHQGNAGCRVIRGRQASTFYSSGRAVRGSTTGNKRLKNEPWSYQQVRWTWVQLPTAPLKL